jgi:protein-tyrosine phosphatase
VLNLRSKFDDRKAGIAPERYLHLPTRDGTPPTLEQLREGVAFMKDEIDRGGAVYVHCEAGVGRSATMVAAYLIDVNEMLPTQAWAKIRSTRPFIRPTSSQKRQIERFTEYIHARQREA